MEGKSKTYWQDFRPLWWEEIKLWFGWTDWVHAVFKVCIHLGGLWCALFLTESLEDFIGSLAVELGKIIVTIFLLQFILAITYLKASNKLYNNQEKSIQQKEEDINRLDAIIQSKTLNLMVEPGNNIVVDVGGGIPKVTLKLDVINEENKKLVELEAYLTTVDQITEELPDDWSFTNSITSFRAQRLEWKDKKYLIDLPPGFPESFIKIVSLDCSIPKVTFINEGYPITNPVLQKDALYNIKIQFRGKLEGETDYRFFGYETMFACAPNRSQIGFLPREKENPNLPDWLRQRINLVLNRKQTE